MFNRNSEPNEETDLQVAITEAIAGLKGLDDGSEEYARAATALKTLMEARAIEVEKIEKSPWLPSADTVVTVAGSLFGIIAILSFEKANVITSKALNFVAKPKI